MNDYGESSSKTCCPGERSGVFHGSLTEMNVEALYAGGVDLKIVVGVFSTGIGVQEHRAIYSTDLII